MKATDVARILRVPETLNHKHDPPVPVMVERQHHGLLSVASIVRHLPDPPGKVTPARKSHAPIVADDLLAVSSEQYYAALTGWEPSLTTRVHCPFWKHKSNPAMMLYEEGTWFCFACGEGGSIYEFGALLWNMERRGPAFVELRERLTRALG